MKQRKIILILFIGIITGFYVVVQPIHSYYIIQVSEATEQEGEKTETVALTNADALPTQTTQVNLSFQSYLIEVVEEGEEINEKVCRGFTNFSGSAVKLIIENIISPNAP